AQELPPPRHALVAAQVEVDARVEAAVAEVPVDRGSITVAPDELGELAQIAAEAQGVDRGVLPAHDRVRRAAGEIERGGRSASLAEGPKARHEVAIGDDQTREHARFLERLLDRVAAE